MEKSVKNKKDKEPEQEKERELKENTQGPDEIRPDQILDELKGYKDKYVRLYAEFENTRKRMEREKIEFIQYANEGLISEFLNILDDLERTVKAASSDRKNNEALLKGVELVMARIYEMLKQNGVRPIEALGKPFDPHFHEILMQEETDEHDNSVIMEELQKGYMYNDKVIRTVKVKIAKNDKSGK